MQIGILGINHKSADLALRESISRICQKRFGSFQHHDFSFVLLSTCNRTEIYFSSNDTGETHSYILNTLRKDLEFAFEHHVYTYFGRDCFLHLATVTSGIDSALIGETEIQRQVKVAYETAKSSRYIERQLHYLFQKSLKIGKDMRSKHKVLQLPSLEETIFKTTTHLLGNLNQKKILLVGLSEINQKILKSFRHKGLNSLTLCNRTYEKIKTIIKTESYLPWEDFDQWSDFDLIIVGTRSTDYLIKSLPSLTKRRVIIDLSVPRNVDPILAKHPLITLLNFDQLTAIIDKKRASEEIAKRHKKTIAELIDRQLEIFLLKESFRLSLHVS